MPKPPQPRIRKTLSSKSTVFVLLIILILICWAITQNLSRQKMVSEESKRLEKEILELEKQNLELSSLIEYFASQEYIEKEAREKLNLGKPGEKIVIMPQEQKNNEMLVNNEEEKEQDFKNAFLKWWKYFFGN